MAIRRDPNAWRGTHAYDLAEYLESFLVGAGAKVIQTTCDCGNRLFLVSYDYDAALAESTCARCGARRQLGNPAGVSRPQLSTLDCGCGANSFELGLAVEQVEDGVWHWGTLGFRCPACGLLGYCANRRSTASRGDSAPLAGFANPDRDRELIKAYPLQLYEVIFWGGAGDPDGYGGRDALYLVAAKDFAEAALHVASYQIHHTDGDEPESNPDMVQELGTAELAEHSTRVLRGPYFAHAYEFAKRRWYWDPARHAWVEAESDRNSYNKHYPL